MADRPTDAGLQDDRRLPPRQRASDPRGLRAVRRAVPSVQSFHADYLAIDGSKFKAVMLAYNMKRMIKIFGVNPLMQAIAA